MQEHTDSVAGDAAGGGHGIGRREFIGGIAGGMAAGGGFLGGLGSASAAQATEKGVYHEKMRTPIVGRYEVIVCGGGPSGFIAALAAARSGANTLLIERYGFLGGNAVAGLMTCYNGFRNQRAPEALQTVKGIPAEYIAEIVRLGGLADQDQYAKEFPHNATTGDLPYTVGFDPEAAKIACLNMIAKDGVRLRLHSWVVAPMLDGSRLTGVIVESKSGRQAIAADIVIDATGDGDVAAGAGAPFMLPDKKGDTSKGDRLQMTLMYRLGGLPPAVRGPFGGIRIGDRVVRWGPYMDGDGLDADDLARVEVETRLRLWDQIQQMRRKPGMESIYLMQTATGVGVRETRRIIGEHIVREKDAVEGKRFADVIAISSNPIPRYHGRRYFFEHEGFDIPYGALVPRKVDGLLLTGRCISCEQAAFQSSRAMAPTMAVGHASGCAAALAVKGKITPRRVKVKDLQKLLLSQNAELRR